jgi:hypothetical protein|tara:strand:- start:36 stop:275 length:240 start_codon:yes stop_codon:yes gene_type:complete
MTRKAAEKSKEPLSPSKRKELRKQKEDKKTKQYLTHDFAYTGIPGATATAKGVRYRVNKQSGGIALRGFGRAFRGGGKV